MLHLDHLCLFVRDLADGVRRVHEETGLAHYDGGVFAPGISNTIFPLGDGAYLEVEAATGSAAEPHSAAGWIDGVVADGADRWMFWSLRADTPEEMTAAARRLGSEVARVPGHAQPDGTQHLITTVPAPGQALYACWRRGLPSLFYRDGPATDPDRAAEHGTRAVAVTSLEIGADAGELREHIGAEAFERLPLEVVSGKPGVHAVTVRTASGREVTLRRDPAEF